MSDILPFEHPEIQRHIRERRTVCLVDVRCQFLIDGYGEYHKMWCLSNDLDSSTFCKDHGFEQRPEHPVWMVCVAEHPTDDVLRVRGDLVWEQVK